MTERERMIELLKNVPRNTRVFYDQFADYLLENGVIAPPTNGWISVDDKLPEDDGLVLVVVNGKHRNIKFVDAIQLAEYCSDGEWILESYPDFEKPDITYWMPLPEPPEGILYRN